MAELVADTSGLVSLGTLADGVPDPLGRCLSAYDVRVPETVVDELREMASYDDQHGQAADAVLARTEDMTIRPVTLDAEFPLDDGENAAVTLANDDGAALFLCDEFNRIGLIHASLADTRLVTTPTLLAVMVRTGELPGDDAATILDGISRARSWDGNSYVRRARSLLEQS